MGRCRELQRTTREDGTVLHWVIGSIAVSRHQAGSTHCDSQELTVCQQEDGGQGGGTVDRAAEQVRTLKPCGVW